MGWASHGFPYVEKVTSLLHEMRKVKTKEAMWVYDPLHVAPTYIKTCEWEKLKAYWVN
jgi:hypothetical protein